MQLKKHKNKTRYFSKYIYYYGAKTVNRQLAGEGCYVTSLFFFFVVHSYLIRLIQWYHMCGTH